MLYFSRWKTILIWFAVLASMIVALPNLFSDQQLDALPKWFPAKKIALGLDLSGGSHIMLKIERADIVKDRLEATVAEVRTRLREAGIRYTGLSGVGQQVQVNISDPSQVEAAKLALKPLADPVAGGPVQEAVITGGQGGQLTLDITDKGIDYRVASALSKSIDVLRLRIEQLGGAQPLIQFQGRDRIVVQVPGLTDPQRLKSLVNQRARLTFNLLDASMPVQQAIDGAPPPGTDVLYSMDDPPVPYLVEKRPLISGENLADPRSGLIPQSNEPVVSFNLDPDAAALVAQAVKQDAGRPVAVVFDDQVLSTATLGDLVTGSTGRVSGNLSAEGADNLALLLRAGALPATLTVVEERTAGSSLGADSINAGLVAAIIAAVLVFLFMAGFYGFLGLIANVALVVNVVMIIAILTLVGSTLTLPGIAGIVLTIGMALDANVLIYERVREEVKNGTPVAGAVGIGFAKAFATIADANLTTLIAAIVLFFMEDGPVRGFATAVAVGIVTTLFTAFTLTRWIVVQWLRERHPATLPKGVRSGILDGANIRFMAIRRRTFLISAALAIASMLGFMTAGMNLGIDFSGGSVIEVKAREGNADLADIRARLSELNLGEVRVRDFGDPTTALIRVQAQGGGENAEQSAITLISDELEDGYEFRRVEVVGPAVSRELTLKATLGVVASLAAILAFIWFRFEWQFALGAIVATLHDVILTIGLFVVTGIEFNLTSIAAILTIVGYSLNDTIVVYDRMRENLRRFPQMPLPVLIDASINQTLSRTILTSATTMLALTALFVFGGEVIHNFALVMLFGVAAGTFSSIYIAAPVLIAFRLRRTAAETAEGVAGNGDLPDGMASE